MAKKKTVTKVPRKKPERRESIACPFCNALFSRVEDTKPVDGEIVRYRRCNRCGKRYPTGETAKWGK